MANSTSVEPPIVGGGWTGQGVAARCRGLTAVPWSAHPAPSMFRQTSEFEETAERSAGAYP